MGTSGPMSIVKTQSNLMMHRALLIFAAVCALLPASHLTQAQTTNVVAGARVIVKYKSESALLTKAAMSADAQHSLQAQALGVRVGLRLRAGAGVAERTHVVLADGVTSEQLAQRLSAESDIEYAVPDELRHHTSAPNDPLYLAGPAVSGTTGGPVVGQWYLRAPSGDVQSSINVEPAWDLSIGSNIVVAVIDTGVLFDHRDLLSVGAGGPLLPGYDMVSEVAFANDGDGRDADPSDPGDWVTLAEIEQPGPLHGCHTDASDSSWHGMQTSSLIGALTNNGIGMASVGRGVRVLPVRVLGKCGGFDSDIIAGMLWAAGISVPGVPANPNPARVLNISLGGEHPCNSAYSDAIARISAVGAVVVASAGNSVGHAVGVPANCAGAIAVGGLRHAGTKVGFSDLGPDIAISAPAGNCVNIGAGEPCLYPIITAKNLARTTPIPDAIGGSIYTDSFRPSLGTSFSAPLVAGTAALMLSLQPSLTAAQVRALLRASARPFPTTGGDNSDGTVVPQCVAPQPIGITQIDQLQCYCTTSTCGAGMLDAGAAVLAAKAIGSPNYTGLFWNAPANSESGWGINFAHQGDQIFATWFTYDTTGKAWWLSMLAERTAANSNAYTGTINASTGPPFNNFVGAASANAVGMGKLTFANTDNASFEYTVNQISQTKALIRFNLGTGAQPMCFYSTTTPNLVAATNYQDLWWMPQESGWGINFAQQGDTIFATWYTYDLDRTPLWLTALAQRQANSNVYSGTIYRTSGPRFDAYDPSKLTSIPVGTAMFTFADGNHAMFDYTVIYTPLPQTKQITRFPFAAAGGVICQ
ncbi:MAG TPA: S8 family peptidase [Casimicrobiaceae bacterium]